MSVIDGVLVKVDRLSEELPDTDVLLVLHDGGAHFEALIPWTSVSTDRVTWRETRGSSCLPLLGLDLHITHLIFEFSFTHFCCPAEQEAAVEAPAVKQPEATVAPPAELDAVVYNCGVVSDTDGALDAGDRGDEWHV